MKRSDSRLGILAFLGATALVLVALVAFARYPSLFRRGTAYRAVFRQVPGLNLGDEVRYGGLLVGSVTALEIDPQDPTRIVVSFRVRRGTPVRVDTRASITQVGFLGQPYLNLAAGKPDAARLAAGDTVPTENNLTFQEAMSRVAMFMDRADTLFGSFERISRTSPLDRLNTTLARVDSLITTTSVSTRAVFAQLDVASEHLGSLIDRSERLVSVLDTTVKTAGPDLAVTQKEALATLREMRTLVAEMRDATARGERVETIARNMEVVSDNLARLTDRIERDPTSVLKRGRGQPKTAGPKARE